MNTADITTVKPVEKIISNDIDTGFNNQWILCTKQWPSKNQGLH